MRRSSGDVPLLTAPLLADSAADAVDARTAKYLLRAALEKLEEEENLEERRKARAHLKAMTELVRRVPRKRKKRRKRKLPRSSSHSSLGRARRRLRQWHARFAGFLGDVPLRAVFPSVVVRPAVLGIMAGMDEKYSGALIVDSGSVMCKARFAGYDTPRAVFPLVVALAVYARGDFTGAVLGQGDMPVLSDVFHQTAQITVEFPQLPFLDKFVQISCRGAEADSHSSDHRDSPLAVLDRGDQRPCCAGRAASQVVVTVAVLGHAGDMPVVANNRCFGFPVQKNCGGPAVAVLPSSLISLSWSRGSIFPGGRRPCCASRVPCPCWAFSTTGSWTR